MKKLFTSKKFIFTTLFTALAGFFAFRFIRRCRAAENIRWWGTWETDSPQPDIGSYIHN